MSGLIICWVCGQEVVAPAERATGKHFKCFSISRSEPSTHGTTDGPVWQYDGGKDSAIAFKLMGHLRTYPLSAEERKFLWRIAGSDARPSRSPCGTRGSYHHDSTGASYSTRSFTSVFFDVEPSERNWILIFGLGSHVDGGTARYRAKWDTGTTTTFDLGVAKDR